MDQRYYCQQRYGGDGGYMDGPPQYGQHMPRNAYKQPYNNYSRPNHNYNNYGKHNNPVPVDTNNYYKQPHPSAPSHWQPMPQPQAPPPPAPPTFAPPPPPPAPVHSKSGKKDVVALIVENNNLKRMIVLHMSLLQEQTDKLEKKNKQLDERNLRIETLLAQKQELLQQVARLGHTVDELRCHRRRSNKRTAIEDVAPKPKVPCFVENQTQTEAMQQQVLVEQVQQVVEPSVVHHCYQPQPQPAPQRKPTQNVIVTSVTELPPTTPALEHIKGHGGFNGGKKFSTIILHRVHQESSSLQLQEEQEKQEHEQDDDADQLQIDEEIQTNMHEQHEVFLAEEEQLEQLQNDEQHIYHDGMEGMTETVIGAEEELGAVEVMAEENINNGHMIEISDMGQVVGHIDIERLRRLGINCVKQSDREHQHQQQLHLYETPQSQLLQSSAEDDVVNALLQSQQSEIILQAEPIETANISEIPQKQKPSKYLAPIANACPEPVKKVRTFAKTRVNQVVRKLPTLENSKRLENVNANYKPHMLAKPVVVQDEEQKRQEAAAEEQKRQLEIQLKQEQEELQQQKLLEQKKREFELQQQQEQEQERKQQLLMEEQLRKQREEQEQEEQRAKQKELERQQQLMQVQLRKQEEERQEQLKKQQEEQERQEQLKKQQELERQEQLKKQEQARQEEIRKKEQQQKRQEEVKQKKQEEHLKMLDLERSEKKKRIQEKKRKQLIEQKKQERDQKKKIEVQKIKERNKARQELLRIQNQKQDDKLISEVQTEVVVKPTQQQPDSKLENQKPVEPQSEPIEEEEEEDVEETIVRRLQEHLQKEQQRMQEHIQKEQQRLQSLQQQQPMVRLKRSPMDSNMGSNTSLIYPPLPQSSSTTSTPATMTSSSTMTPAPTPPPTNAVSPRLRGVKSNASTTTQTTTTTTVTAATEKATPPTPLTPQSASSKRKRQQTNKQANNRNTSKFLTSLQPYTTRSWEDQEFHCDNEFFIEEADELLADNPSLEIPKWKVVKLPRCNDDKNIERLNNTVYELRHDKYVRDEIERKKRDARYNLEQNKIEALRQRHNQDEVLVPLPPLPTSTFYPLPEDIEGIQFVTEVPVQAFGENMLNPHTQDGHFSLPWLAATLAATAEERAKAAAMPVATLANKKLPTTKKESSHQEQHSSYVFLKRRKRQQRR